MSASPLLPYVRSCGFCENGLLRLWIRNDGKHPIALCDECELYWEDIQAVFDDEGAPSSGAFPALKGNWRMITRKDLEANQLAAFVRGESE